MVGGSFIIKFEFDIRRAGGAVADRKGVQADFLFALISKVGNKKTDIFFMPVFLISPKLEKNF